MRSEKPIANQEWSVGIRVWVERGGRAILGKGRLELLEAINGTRSISAAARQLGMSYRRAWLLVQRINEGAGEVLVETSTGGTDGGGASLTAAGQQAMLTFRTLQGRLQTNAAQLLPTTTSEPDPAALLVAAAVSLEEVLGRLLADLAQKHPPLRPRALFAASNVIVDYLLGGMPADVVLLADPDQLDRLESAGLTEPGSRTVLTRNGLAAIAQSEWQGRVRRPQDLRCAAVGRLALAEAASPLGRYSHTYLEDLGLYQELIPRAVWCDNAHAVLAAVNGSQAEVGLVYGSDAARAAGCRILFRAGRKNPSIRYLGAVCRHAPQQAAAQALLAFLGSRSAARRFRECGFLAISN
jgi:molybdenum ABC transporter molybdate-binding protein